MLLMTDGLAEQAAQKNFDLWLVCTAASGVFEM